MLQLKPQLKPLALQLKPHKPMQLATGTHPRFESRAAAARRRRGRGRPAPRRRSAMAARCPAELTWRPARMQQHAWGGEAKAACLPTLIASFLECKFTLLCTGGCRRQLTGCNHLQLLHGRRTAAAAGAVDMQQLQNLLDCCLRLRRRDCEGAGGWCCRDRCRCEYECACDSGCRCVPLTPGSRRVPRAASAS